MTSTIDKRYQLEDEPLLTIHEEKCWAMRFNGRRYMPNEDEVAVFSGMTQLEAIQKLDSYLLEQRRDV